jgi:membrane protease YdiL (CAAX protease family)
MMGLLSCVAVLCPAEHILAAVPVLEGGGAVASPNTAEPASFNAWWLPPLAMVIVIVLLSRKTLRFRQLPRFPWTFKPGTGLLFFAATLLAAVIGQLIGSAFVTVPAPDAVDALPASEMLKIVTIMSFCSLLCQGVVLVFMPGWWHGRAPGQADRREGTLACIVQGVLAFIIILPIVLGLGIVVQTLISEVTGTAPDPLGHQTLRALVHGQGSIWFWTTAALVVLAAPVVEEVLYRGLLQESLRRHRVLMGGSPWGSIIIASIFFTLMHVGAADWQGLPSLFVLSLGLGWIFTRTGRLIAPITVHMLFNGFNLFMAV